MTKLIAILLFALAFKAEAQNFPQAAVYPVQTVKKTAGGGGGAGVAYVADTSMTIPEVNGPTRTLNIIAGSNNYTVVTCFYRIAFGTTLDSVVVSGTGGGKMTSIFHPTSVTIDSGIALYGIKNLGVGAHNFKLWSSGYIDGDLVISELTGVSQTTPLGTISGGTAVFGGDPPVMITNPITTTSGQFLFDVVGNRANNNLTAQSGQSVKISNLNTFGWEMSLGIKTTAGSNTQWSMPGGALAWYTAVIINPAP